MTKLGPKTRPSNATACCVARPVRARVRRDAAGLVPLLRALGDETRFQIVALLAAARRELCVCDIEANFTLGQPTVSHHLRILREAGVVTAERRGSWVYYALDPSALKRLKELDALLGAG